MNNFKKLPITLALLALASCNEKVSPELQNASSSTTVPTTVTPSEYYFKVTNSSPTILNYNLHKTGSGNYQADCKISSTTALTNTKYRTDATNNDITCFFEAEELSLHYGGANFEVASSANTCDYIGYAPFSFFDRMPGDSSGSFTTKKCSDEVIAADAAGFGPVANGANVSCNEWVDNSLAAGTRDPFYVESDDDLCRFNYEDGEAEQCDVGVITVTEISVTVQVDPTTGARTPASTSSTRTVRCGGKPANCIKGPIRLLSGTEANTRYTELTQTEANSDFSKEYVLPSLFTEGKLTNRSYVNFRRHLANTEIDFDESSLTTFTNPYINSFSGYKTFDPSVMDRYSNAKVMNGATHADFTSALSVASIVDGAYTVVPYAAEPFIGLNGYRTNPYYTFYCLDTAFDIKARIRMVVRDWDRVFPGTSDMEYLSDIFLDTSARQDNPMYSEIEDEQDPHNSFNDIEDWDDFIPMKRTVGIYDIDADTSTAHAHILWQPLPVGVYTEGFFNPDYFTNGDL